MTSISRTLVLAIPFCLATAIPGASLQAGTISYAYDQLGRLSQVTYPGGAVIRYNYDANGNRTSYVVSGSANAPPTGTPPVGQAQSALVKTEPVPRPGIERDIATQDRGKPSR